MKGTSFLFPTARPSHRPEVAVSPNGPNPSSSATIPDAPQSAPLQNVPLEAIDGLREVGRYCHSRSLSLGTSSNYSVVLSHDPLELLVTASGKDKSRLSREDFVRVGGDGKPVVDGQPKSSAETLLHIEVAQNVPGVGAILHTHSVWSTILSQRHLGQGGLMIAGYEMLKGLSGVTTHEHEEWFPIFENTQDIAALAVDVAAKRKAGQVQHGYLISGHGLYTWGSDLAEAMRHIEIIEFLLECVGRRAMLEAGTV